MKKIGFIGLGIMGKPMVKNLLKAGFEVTAYDILPAAVQEDEKELSFLRKLQQADIPLPDVIGDELMDGDMVLDLVELGWTKLKKAFILKECQESCENVRKAGWQVFDETTEDVQAIFGGREE